MLNDDLPNRIVTGTVKVKDNVQRFTQTGVEFVDGTSEQHIDVVILATGFRTCYPFLEDEVGEGRKEGRFIKVIVNIVVTILVILSSSSSSSSTSSSSSPSSSSSSPILSSSSSSSS